MAASLPGYLTLTRGEEKPLVSIIGREEGKCDLEASGGRQAAHHCLKGDLFNEIIKMNLDEFPKLPCLQSQRSCFKSSPTLTSMNHQAWQLPFGAAS